MRIIGLIASLLIPPSLSFASGKYALVTNAYCSRVGKIDISRDSVIAELPVADSIGIPVPNITNIAVDTVHHWAYVADHLANALSIIDLDTWTTTGPIVPAGMGKAPIGMALNKACNRMYLATYGVDGLEDPTDPVEVYDISGSAFPPTLTKIASVPAGKHPINIALNHAETYVIVTCRNQACFTVISTSADTVAYTRTYPSTNYEPEGLDIHPTEELAYVFSHGQNIIEVFDFDSLKVVNSVTISNATPPQPSGGTFSPDGSRLLVSGQSAGKLFVFDTSDPRHPVQLPPILPAGPQPHAALFVADTIAYVPNTNNTQPVGSISIVSTGAVPRVLGQVRGLFHGPLGMVLVSPPVQPCCQGSTGNIDGDPDDIVDISDLSALIDYLFDGGTINPCPAAVDIDSSGSVDIADLTMLIAYLFSDGSLPMCPAG